MDPRFRRSQCWVLVAASILSPALVIYWTIIGFQILLSVFIFAASVHVLHQNAYLTDLYRKKLRQTRAQQFLAGDIEILIPRYLKRPEINVDRVPYAAVAAC